MGLVEVVSDFEKFVAEMIAKGELPGIENQLKLILYHWTKAISNYAHSSLRSLVAKGVTASLKVEEKMEKDGVTITIHLKVEGFSPVKSKVFTSFLKELRDSGVAESIAEELLLTSDAKDEILEKYVSHLVKKYTEK